MNKELVYPAVLSEEDGEIVVSFPDLPHALTSGASFKEALELAEDCLGEALAYYINHGEELPEPSKLKTGMVPVPAPPTIALTYSIILEMNLQHITKVQLAERLGVNEKEVRRITDPHHPTKIQKLVQALRVLGKQVVTRVEDLPEHA